MIPKLLKNRFVLRTLVNIAAIVAVSTIFGAKALELERRTALSQQSATVAASLGGAR